MVQHLWSQCLGCQKRPSQTPVPRVFTATNVAECPWDGQDCPRWGPLLLEAPLVAVETLVAIIHILQRVWFSLKLNIYTDSLFEGCSFIHVRMN